MTVKFHKQPSKPTTTTKSAARIMDEVTISAMPASSDFSVVILKIKSWGIQHKNTGSQSSTISFILSSKQVVGKEVPCKTLSWVQQLLWLEWQKLARRQYHPGYEIRGF